MRELLRRGRTPDVLLQLTTAELARALLEAMRERALDPTAGMANRDFAVTELFSLDANVDPMRRRQIEKDLGSSFRAAFKLLDEWELIEPADGTNGKNGYVTLTEKGRASQERVDFDEVRQRSLLAPEMLHPLLQGDVYSDFKTGRFGKAVFEAFKIVEIQVRGAAGRPESEHGADLIRIAFNENGGVLTDMAEKPGHRDALRMLFSGSLGRFKNPESHTYRGFSDAFEPMQELMLASRLLRIVDERRTRLGSSGSK